MSLYDIFNKGINTDSKKADSILADETRTDDASASKVDEKDAEETSNTSQETPTEDTSEELVDVDNWDENDFPDEDSETDEGSTGETVESTSPAAEDGEDEAYKAARDKIVNKYGDDLSEHQKALINAELERNRILKEKHELEEKLAKISTEKSADTSVEPEVDKIEEIDNQIEAKEINVANIKEAMDEVEKGTAVYQAYEAALRGLRADIKKLNDKRVMELYNKAEREKQQKAAEAHQVYEQTMDRFKRTFNRKNLSEEEDKIFVSTAREFARKPEYQNVDPITIVREATDSLRETHPEIFLKVYDIPVDSVSKKPAKKVNMSGGGAPVADKKALTLKRKIMLEGKKRGFDQEKTKRYWKYLKDIVEQREGN